MFAPVVLALLSSGCCEDLPEDSRHQLTITHVVRAQDLMMPLDYASDSNMATITMACPVAMEKDQSFKGGHNKIEWTRYPGI
jgi:hypothetical protein